MEPGFSPLAEFLGDEFDGYLIPTDGDNSNQLYLFGFDAPDPCVTLYMPAGVHLFVSMLEFGHTKKESCANAVSRLSDYDYRDSHAEYDAIVGKARTVAVLLASHEIDSLAVLVDSSFDTTDALREEGVAVDVEADDAFTNIRAVEAGEEVERTHTAQDTNKAAMRAAEGLIRDTDVADDGTLTYEGKPLTGEHVRGETKVTLLRHGCAPDETVVVCGADAADPHDRGSGPLQADEVVVIGIFPRGKEAKYNGDTTRTFAKGEPSPKVHGWFDPTEEAFETALNAVKPSATDKDVYDAVYDVCETTDESTFRADPSTEIGLIHNTGHDVGLDTHELPSPSPNGEELRSGHVITIELELYDPEIGGVRVKDLVVVTEDDHENLAEYPVKLVVG